MSLINDALKRASQSDRNRPRPSENYPAMQPVASGKNSYLSVVLVAGVFVTLALAALLFWWWWAATHPAPQMSVQPTVVQTPASAPPPATALPVAHEVAPVPVVAAPVVVKPAPVPAPAPVAVPASPPAAPAEPVWPASLKVTGIFFSKTNPRAFINGKTVGEGDDIEGIKVRKIEADRVTVEWDGKTRLLRME